MSGLMKTTLVSVRQLAGLMKKPLPSDVRILDSSWHLPVAKRNARLEYETKHIPGALFFDIDECVDKNTNLEHMVPTAADFERYVGNLGISNKTHVIVYDASDWGLFSAQRAWWTFRVFGHESVSILDGGFTTWVREGHPITDEVPTVIPESFTAKFHPDWVKSFENVVENLARKNFQLADARSAGRFQGTAPEPRPDTRPGHIPGSVNIPFPTILDLDTNTVKSPEDLKKVFADAGVDLSKPLTASCGTGVTACGIALAAFLCGKKDVSIYDGSWLEWYKRSRPDQRAQSPED